MCGIIGLWAPRLPSEERLKLAHRMLRCLRHRGPDGEALWESDGIALGIARLAIVARETMPSVFASEDKTIRAVVNGEIYNHRALRQRLIERGRRLPSGPDTAVIPDLYQEHGADFPVQLEGMFAAAVWDSRKQRLLLARDRMGEKPLFVARSPHALAFASEPRSLVALPWISRDLSPPSLLRYLAHGYFAGTDCSFAQIEQVRAAHVLEFEWEPPHESRRRYWRPWDALGKGGTAPPRSPERADTLAAVEMAVQSRIPENIPFGVLLSGGVDSGLVVALASRWERGFPTFNLRMREAGYDESDLARKVAAKFGTEHHELIFGSEKFVETITELARHMDQPLGDPSLLPTWLVTRLASSHVRVVLTGEGSDELFAGYPTYLGHRLAPYANILPEAWRTKLLGWLGARRSEHPLSVPRLVERFLRASDQAPFRRHHTWFGTADPARAHDLLAPELRAGLDRQEALTHLADFEDDLSLSGLEKLTEGRRLVAYQLLDLEHYLGSGLLTKVDRCAMAHGLESRAPFLSRDLVEFALQLPERSKLRGTQGKWILKQAARAILPSEILTRRKRGFSPPFSSWARGPLRDAIADRLSTPRVERAGVLDGKAVEAVLTSHQGGQAERGRLLWTLLSLQMWAETWRTASPETSEEPESLKLLPAAQH